MDDLRRSLLQYSVTGYRATDGPGSGVYLTDLVHALVVTDIKYGWEDPALAGFFLID
jgi:hypothetical protein